MRRAAVCVAVALVAGAAGLGAQEKSGAARSASATAQAADLTGTWQGTITPPNPNANGQRIEMKVTKDGAQAAPYKGTLYLVDLGPNGRAMAAPAIAMHGAQLSFAIPTMNMSYAGTLTADGKTMVGAIRPLSGPGTSTTMPLNLIHVPEDAAWPIPQFVQLMAKDAHPKFEVVTVKPHPPGGRGTIGFQGHEFVQMGYTVDSMIGLAYGLHVDQLVGAPDWFHTDLWDIVGVPDTPGRPSNPQSEELTHDVLATRFGMKFHMEQRELSAYVITIAKGGPKLMPTASGPDDPPGVGLGFGNATMHNITIANFGKWFQTYVLDRPVIDRTGLTGYYDFTLKWAPDDSQFLQGRGAGAPPRPPLPDEIAAQPALNEAFERQLGLKIERMKTMVDVMVIDYAEKPGAN
jgi:uncharacterized protein (TIGR03435 family)